MKNNPEIVKEYLMWMVGRPPAVTQEWIFVVLQQFMEEKELSMDEVQALIPIMTNQEVIRGEQMPEDVNAQAFLDRLVDYLQEMKSSGEY